MLAARRLTLQRLTTASSSSSRHFATALSETANTGVKIAAVDFGQPASAVTVLVKAGSRYQNKEGLANVLKNFAFKSTTKRSAIGTVREAELYGGVLSASLGREHLGLTAEFLRGDEAFFIDVLSSFITSARFTRHEFEEYVTPLVSSDTHALSQNPAARALEAAHALAFRSGLGHSLFAPENAHIEVNDVKQFAEEAFRKGNIAVVGTNIEMGSLTKLVDASFAGDALAGATDAHHALASKYFGGETRLEGNHEGPQTVFIGFGTSGVSARTELATLAAHLSTTPSIKWCQSLSPIVEKGIPEGTSVQSVYLPYSDASLFGLVVQGDTAEKVKEAGKVAVEALKVLGKGGVGEKDLVRAVMKAKFGAASLVERREGLVDVLGSKIFGGADVSVESDLAAFDKVTAASFSQVVSSLISAKPTFVAVGDTMKLPHADELGF